MSITTSSQITRYYDAFKDVDITFTKEVIRASLLNTKQIYIKLQGYQWPCVIYSSSLSGAKIVANITPTLKKSLKESKAAINLRFSFLQRDKRNPISFFVPCRITGFTPYKSGDPNNNLHFISMTFTQRPPNDLIEILGRIQEANSAAHNRKEERVVLTNTTIQNLSLTSKGGMLMVDGIPRKCIVRDISFGGSKIILMGVAQFLVKKDIVLRLGFTEPPESIDIPGTIIRFEPVEGRSDLAAFAVKFKEDTIPMRYKLRLNAYLKTITKPKTPVQKLEAQDNENNKEPQ
ncbi:PilZN3 domain-containing protein [Spirochaeta dissipatitropha]